MPGLIIGQKCGCARSEPLGAFRRKRSVFSAISVAFVYNAQSQAMSVSGGLDWAGIFFSMDCFFASFKESGEGGGGEVGQFLSKE